MANVSTATAMIQAIRDWCLNKFNKKKEITIRTFYYSRGGTNYVFNNDTKSWDTMEWSGLTSFNGRNIWTDGKNIYYSSDTTQYVLDKSTNTWNTKTWNITSIDGQYIWTDGDSIYYSYPSSGSSGQYVLDKSTSTWNPKTWNGSYQNIYGFAIWTDGENIYYSKDSSNQRVLDKTTDTWNTKTWNGLGMGSVSGDSIWAYGDTFCYSNSNQYVLNRSTDTWSSKVWEGDNKPTYGKNVWSDGDYTYYGYGLTQLYLDTSTDTWDTWESEAIYGEDVWYIDEKVSDPSIVLDDLSDVSLSQLSLGDVLTYNSSDEMWTNYKALTCLKKYDECIIINLATITTTPQVQYVDLPSGHRVNDMWYTGFVGSASLVVDGSDTGYTMPIGNIMVVPAGITSEIVTDCKFQLYVFNNKVYLKQVEGEINNPYPHTVQLMVNLMIYEVCF